PSLLMDPAITTGLPLDLDLTRQQMRDIGWYRDSTADLVPDTITNVVPGGGSVLPGSTVSITWTNNGGFNRNVTIELSTDGGSTFPTTIATNVANTGSFAWTVPNIATSTARVRVREHNFIAPLGASAANFAISGCPTITVNPATLSAGTRGAAYSQSFTQTGGAGTITWSISAGALPTGLTLSAAGVLSGTPTVGGTFNFTVRAAASNGCSGTRAYTLVINCPTITVNPATLTAGLRGAAYSQTFTQTGGAGAITWSRSTGTLPAGLALSAAGVLSGTPTQVGTFNFTVRAADAQGCAGTRSYTLVINCPTITISPTSLPAGTRGTAYSRTFTQTGGVGTITWSRSAGTLPTGLTLSSAGVLSGTPTARGTFNFTVRAADAQGCAGTRSYSLVIN
ncbi:MAG TPA: putative Ig domain-containing protein, partial [Blastocatellia bacterium]|nr:putative Ig domain-containing protein [Blastocatellia bacterium]